MSHVVVVNSYARTVKILTTPVTHLTDVRDEACKKFGIKKDQYTLKYNNKNIPLSQQIRLANLPQGARLELVQASRSPTVISVALQLPAIDNSVRLTQKFASNTSLWEILRQFESSLDANYNFTQRGVPEMSGISGAGRLYYEMPVVTVMPSHKEQTNFAGLQQTLGQLGFDSGSALLKLSYKTSGTPLEEAMAQISHYFRVEVPPSTNSELDPTSSTQESPALPANEVISGRKALAVTQNARDKVQQTEPMDVDTIASSEPAANPIPPPRQYTSIEEESTSKSKPGNTAPTAVPINKELSPLSSGPSDKSRNVQIFSAPSSSTPQAARTAFNESDYQPTVEHAKSHQAALLNKTMNRRLLSDKELEEQEKMQQERLSSAAEKGGILRVRMTDMTLIQRDLTKADTAGDLYDFVRTLLNEKNEPFLLKFTGHNGRLVLIARDNKRLMQDLHFFNNELVTFQWAEDASAAVRTTRQALSPEWQAKSQTLKVTEPVSVAPQQAPTKGQTMAEGKRKVTLSAEEKESKLKTMLGKSLFKKK